MEELLELRVAREERGLACELGCRGAGRRSGVSLGRETSGAEQWGRPEGGVRCVGGARASAAERTEDAPDRPHVHRGGIVGATQEHFRGAVPEGDNLLQRENRASQQRASGAAIEAQARQADCGMNGEAARLAG